MKEVFVHGEYMISSLGVGMSETREKLFAGESGSMLISDPTLYPDAFFGSQIDKKRFNDTFEALYPEAAKNYTYFEKLLIFVIQNSLNSYRFNYRDEDTLLIISSTKGNIDLLHPSEKKKWENDRVFLWKSAQKIQDYFKLANPVQAISNACISGIEAIAIGSRFIRSNTYKNVIVAGADILSEFVVSGFQSFQSLSTELCRPFDKDRVGLNLGEAAGALVLNENPGETKSIQVLGAGISNDANHISGPSRTGDGLFLAIKSAMEEFETKASDINFISAHGTATNYNDEMESKALKLAGLENVAVNSLKGYWGHTLGAAGLIESIATLESMKANTLIKTLGYSHHGVSVPLPVITETRSHNIQTALKTASGFGGANAAVIFKKNN